MILPPFTGCVLTGGRSTRMGVDKATLVHRGAPLALIPARALEEAGAESVFCLGGDSSTLTAAGLRCFADRVPGSGPLSAIVDAFDMASTEVLVVLACDLPRASAQSVRETVAGLSAPTVAAMPRYGGRPQYLHAAYHRDVLEPLRRALGTGVQSMRAALDGVSVATVTVADPDSLADADTPGDLE